MRSSEKWFSWSLVVVVLDQITKLWVTKALAQGEIIPLTPFFNLVLTYNPGAAFSFLSQASGWQRWFFIIIGLVASALIVYLLRKHPGEKLFCVGLSLILGGALGNLWDRLALGHVVDFLDLYYGSAHWPAFNLADSAITCGAALLIWDGFRKTGVKE